MSAPRLDESTGEPRVVAAQSDQTSLVPEGGRFEGLIAFDLHACIDGELVGRVWGSGELALAPTAVIRGEVEVDSLVLAGRFEGEARARERIRLEPEARVEGGVETPALSVAEGARLDVSCQAGGSPQPRAIGRDSSRSGG